MVLTSENIKQTNKVEQEDAQILATILLENLFVVPSDNEKSISLERSVINMILNGTDDDALSSEIHKLKSSILLENFFVVSSDNEKSINRKILILQSLKETLLKNTDIDTLSSEIQELNFIRLISKMNAQIEAFEIIVGKKDLEALKRAGKRFANKTQLPIGIN